MFTISYQIDLLHIYLSTHLFKIQEYEYSVVIVIILVYTIIVFYNNQL